MTPSRPILWNVSSPINVFMLYALLAVTLLIAAIGIWRRVQLWTSGKPASDYKGNWLSRFYDLFSWAFLQRGVVRERSGGIMHSLIYIGFLALLFTTTMVFIDHDLGIRVYQGSFYLAVTVFSDVLGLGLLIGCLFAGQRRYVKHTDKLHNRFADGLLLNLLAVLVVQGFILEALRIYVTDDPWARYSIVGYLVAQLFWGLSDAAATKIHFFMWWFHTITVYVFIALMPYTKLFHVLSSTTNLFFRRSSRAKGELAYPGDLEKMVEQGDEFSIGLGTIKDYSWKNLLDLDACTSCGRCQDACPAYLTNKPLSPKWLILDTRNHAIALNSKNEIHGGIHESQTPKAFIDADSALIQNFFLKSIGLEQSNEGGYVYEDGGSFRADNERVQKSAIKIGASPDDRIAGQVMEQDVFWSCTTCMACVEACPVGINHVDQIIGNRRNMTLMQGELPVEAQATLRALENRANPYGAPQDRIKWMEGLKVKIVQPGDEVDYLYWVGCVSAYDPRKQKIARALVSIMDKAGLSFGILGTAEGCTGDPARRLGEENLFQTLAKSNIEVLKSIKFKTIVANCPHCFNTIKNEYPQFGNLGEGRKPEIIHHSKLLQKLIAENKLLLKEGSDQKVTFHDPCYLGRYNDEYDAPRDSIKAVKGLNILEMDKSREKGMCCGAGGGHFWMDLKVGERVNALRSDQAAATGADKVATACPFCLQMMEDGMKITNREDKMQVRDIAEIVLENML